MSQSSEENQLVAQRRRKLGEWREEGAAFPNDFRRDALAGELKDAYGESAAEALEAEDHQVAVGGRMMSKRVMGKASFVHIEDVSGRIQLFVRRDDVGEECYGRFKSWDVGDIVGATGTLFKTRTGELSVRTDSLRLLVKALRPLPEKFHGLSDQEQRYRQRYLDLIVNAETRAVMRCRTAIVRAIRAFFDQRDFLEVETPMMHSIPGGAAARPFSTHHNALDTELYLRIAPELYLKRLVVGGFERVYELNRNFRNEGVSTRHNPEFTMLEFYQAYATYEDAMDLTEELIRTLAHEVLQTESLLYQGLSYDLSGPFRRLTLKEAIIRYNKGVCEEDLAEIGRTKALANRFEAPILPDWGIGKVLLQIFEKTVEHQLGEPTFITAYPKEVSPLARQCDADPELTDRFEFFIAGREIANGFSELNDYEEQAERFRQQVAQKEAGDDEAMVYDADYVRALEYGLPPTAGEGLGIDRLVMLFTDSASIRDVLLFPHLRREVH